MLLSEMIVDYIGPSYYLKSLLMMDKVTEY